MSKEVNIRQARGGAYDLGWEDGQQYDLLEAETHAQYAEAYGIREDLHDDFDRRLKTLRQYAGFDDYDGFKPFTRDLGAVVTEEFQGRIYTRSVDCENILPELESLYWEGLSDALFDREYAQSLDDLEQQRFVATATTPEPRGRRAAADLQETGRAGGAERTVVFPQPYSPAGTITVSGEDVTADIPGHRPIDVLGIVNSGEVTVYREGIVPVVAGGRTDLPDQWFAFEENSGQVYAAELVRDQNDTGQ